jgi:hypothetical protein
MKFDNWKMKDKPFLTFIAKFQILAAKYSKTFKQKVDAFRSSVSDEFKTAIMFIPAISGKNDINGWILLFYNVYNNMKKA